MKNLEEAARSCGMVLQNLWAITVLVNSRFCQRCYFVLRILFLLRNFLSDSASKQTRTFLFGDILRSL